MNWSSSKGFFTRALPFAATFLIAVFITSFLVDLNGPRMCGFHGKRHKEMKRLRMENQELRNENLRLQEQLDNQQLSNGHKHHGDEFGVQELKDISAIPALPAVPHAKR